MVAPERHVTNAEQLADLLFKRVESAVKKSLLEQESCHIVLPGGSVGDMLFPRLRQAELPWSRLHFYWGDERAVPLTHQDSNYHQAERLWLRYANLPSQNVHAIQARPESLQADALEYERSVFEALGTRRSFDLAVLGVGADAHVCSLFPGHALLEEKVRWLGAVYDSPKKPAARITLTLPALAASQRVLVAASGRAKAGAISESLQASSSTPLARLLDACSVAELVLDRAAAGSGQ